MEKQDDLIVRLKEVVAEKDHIAVGNCYVELLRRRLLQHEPSFVKMIEKIISTPS